MNVPPKVLRKYVAGRRGDVEPIQEPAPAGAAPQTPTVEPAPVATEAPIPVEASATATTDTARRTAVKLPIPVGRNQSAVSTPAGGSVESLPVLKAFDEFLTVERRRTEKRVLLVGLASIALMIAVGGAGLFMALYVIRQLQSDIGQVQKDVAFYKSEAASLRAANRTAMDFVAEETKKLKADLEKNKDQGSAAVLERLKSYAAEMETMLSKVEGLNKENSSLRADLAKLRVSVTESLAARNPAPVPATQPPSAAAATEPPRVASTPETTVAARGQPVSVEVLPPGWKEPVMLRLPIPE